MLQGNQYTLFCVAINDIENIEYGYTLVERFYMSKFYVRKLKNSDISAMRSSWAEDLENTNYYFPSHCDRDIDYAQKQVDSGGESIYGIFEENSNSILAFVEIVKSPTVKSVVKLLECRMRPMFDANELRNADGTIDTERSDKHIDILFTALDKMLDIASEDNTQEIKIYGREDILLEVLRDVDRKLKKNGSKIKSSVNSRWLVLRLK